MWTVSRKREKPLERRTTEGSETESSESNADYVPSNDDISSDDDDGSEPVECPDPVDKDDNNFMRLK